LTIKKPSKKGRAIVEIDTDGSYVMSEKNIQESAHVNKFDKFILDIRSILEARKQRKNIRR
jgi:type II restriction enzyme